MTIKVLVVDDSALIRSILAEIIDSSPDLTLIGTAPDAYVAKDLVKQFRPDVITLDIEMPKVDGITFLDRLMTAYPTPVLMISTLTQRGAEATLKCLELGAIDFIPKPRIDVARGMSAYRDEIIAKLKTVARATPIRRHFSAEFKQLTLSTSHQDQTLVAIGASTGGTEALKVIFRQLPEHFPPILVTQHMPPKFTATFAERLNGLSAMTVKEAEHHERVRTGHVYVAPGDKHIRVKRTGAELLVMLDDGPAISGHKPSVDVMFQSVAEHNGAKSLGVILTGMGRDGAEGLLKLRQLGALTIAQDESSSVVFGMPKEAIKLGATDTILPLPQIAMGMIKGVEAISRRR